MNLSQTLDAVAAQLRLDPAALKAYAAEDTLGGWHPDPALRQRWHLGGVWEVEGQTLYALIRALKPECVIECGSYYGCSTHHLMEALWRNGTGQLISIDNGLQGGHFTIEERYQGIITQVHADAMQWLQENDISTCGLIFEDMMHTEESAFSVWDSALKRAKPGAVIISHDAAHYIVGANVMRGIIRAGGKVQVYLTEPAECGLAIGQKL